MLAEVNKGGCYLDTPFKEITKPNDSATTFHSLLQTRLCICHLCTAIKLLSSSSRVEVLRGAQALGCLQLVWTKVRIGSGIQRRGFVCSILCSDWAVAAQRTDVDIQKAFETALCSHASLNHQNESKLEVKPTLKSVPELPFSGESPGTPHRAMERSENPHFTLTRITL